MVNRVDIPPQAHQARPKCNIEPSAHEPARERAPKQVCRRAGRRGVWHTHSRWLQGPTHRQRSTACTQTALEADTFQADKEKTIPDIEQTRWEKYVKRRHSQPFRPRVFAIKGGEEQCMTMKSRALRTGPVVHCSPMRTGQALVAHWHPRTGCFSACGAQGLGTPAHTVFK